MVLPTGFGKRFIFQLFLKIKEKMPSKMFTPLRSITYDQIKEAEGLELMETSLAASFHIGRRCAEQGIS